MKERERHRERERGGGGGGAYISTVICIQRYISLKIWPGVIAL